MIAVNGITYSYDQDVYRVSYYWSKYDETIEIYFVDDTEDGLLSLENALKIASDYLHEQFGDGHTTEIKRLLKVNLVIAREKNDT